VVWCCCSPLQHGLQRCLVHCAEMIHNAHGLEGHKLRWAISQWRYTVLCATLAHIQRVHACCATSYAIRWLTCMPQLNAVQHFALWIALTQPAPSVQVLQASIPVPLGARSWQLTISAPPQSLNCQLPLECKYNCTSAKLQDSRAPRNESS
jgi:hypothetical protein